MELLSQEDTGANTSAPSPLFAGAGVVEAAAPREVRSIDVLLGPTPPEAAYLEPPGTLTVGGLEASPQCF